MGAKRVAAEPLVGFYSELLACSFWFQTSDEGVVTRLTADLDPHHRGFLIPDDYQSDELPLWRVQLQPRSRHHGAEPPADPPVGLR